MVGEVYGMFVMLIWREGFKGGWEKVGRGEKECAKPQERRERVEIPNG